MFEVYSACPSEVRGSGPIPGSQSEYNVHPMKHYSVALVRERLAEALNEVDRGVPVIIERRGVRYRLTREPAHGKKTARKPVIQQVDKGVLSGEWAWDWTPDGLALPGQARR